MADLTSRDRLQPALLDRLIDDEPQKTVESRDRRVMSMRQLRKAVLRDLEWLLNSPARSPNDELYNHPLVAKSVVNYGIPDLTGMTASTLKGGRLERMVFDAIANFEPRIVRSSLQVAAKGEAEGGHAASSPSVYEFAIAGDLCPLPMPEALFLRSEVDLETGRCDLKEG